MSLTDVGRAVVLLGVLAKECRTKYCINKQYQVYPEVSFFNSEKPFTCS